MKTKEMYVYASTALICVALLMFNLQGVDLSIPFAYAGDGVLNAMLVKTVVDTGWYMHNPNLGAPYGMDMNDFPISEGFNFILIKLISVFTNKAGLVMNLYYLLTYLITSITSLYVMRKLKLSVPASVVGSLLFAFIPYHFLRGEYHLFLSGFYMIPLILLVLFWVWEGKLSRSQWITSAIILLIVSSSGIYYAFFTCIFLMLVGVISIFNERNIKTLIAPVVLVMVIVIGGLVNIAPNLIFNADHGKNPMVAKRSYVESEVYALKLTNLLLPVNDHRIKKLAEFKHGYSVTAPLTNENGAASLGIIGSLGFLILIFSMFIKHKDDTLKRLSKLNVSAFLLSSIGGLGTIIAILFITEIRGYNRISVFIGYFSILAICMMIDKLKFSKWIASSIFIILLTVGIYDQTSSKFSSQSDYSRNDYKINEKFVNQIENSVPAGSMIFQLPYMPFPENGPIHKMGDYAHGKVYLHSNTLRWSYGAMKGREGDQKIKEIASMPTDSMIDELRKRGYKGIYVDRNGFADKKAEEQLTSILGNPMENESKNLIFYKIN